MEIDFWQQRWHDDQTGFHMPEINEHLIKYWSAISVQPASAAFVPLCGKSLDLLWLAKQQSSVIGVECSEKAVKAFFAEQQQDIQPVAVKPFNCYTGKNIVLYQGDFFALNKEMLSDVSAVYDRASLVALPENMRSLYVQHLANKLPESVSILLITMEYDQQLMSGPPFSVTDDEVQRLYKPFFSVELLEEQDVIENEPRFKGRGLNQLFERVYKVFR